MKEKIGSLNIDWINVVVLNSPGNWLSQDPIFEVTPKEFLRYAKTDLKLENKHGFINALTNAKRAMDCQADLFVESLGLKATKKFPESVNVFISKNCNHQDANKNFRLIEALGVAPSGVLSRYRTFRNKLEHFYQIPDIKLIEESIELAVLFISTLDNAMRSFSFSSIASKNKCDEGKGYIEMYYRKAGQLELTLYSCMKNLRESKIDTCILSPEDDLYMNLMKVNLLVGTEIGWDESIKEFILEVDPKIQQRNIKPEMAYA